MRRTAFVVFIIATLVACHDRERARETALREDLFEMRKAIDNFYADKRRYPDSLQELVSRKYLRRIPKDPITMRADWVEVHQTGGRGVIDVKSAAPGKDLNGIPFRNF